MGSEARIKVRKRNAVYIPKRIAKETGISEGTDLIITASRNRITMEVVDDPIELAVKGRKYATATFEELEAISKEEQSLHGNPA